MGSNPGLVCGEGAEGIALSGRDLLAGLGEKEGRQREREAEWEVVTNRDGECPRCVLNRAVYWLLERGLIEKRYHE
jgi:hypothetical protein